MWKKTLLTAGLAVGLTTVFSTPAVAQDAEAAVLALDNALPGKLMHNPYLADWQMRGDDKRIKVVEADTPNGQAISARVKKRKTKPWDVVLWIELDDGVEKGDEVEIHFWARTAKAPKSKDAAEFVVFVGRNEEPFDNIISEEFSPGDEWKLHTLKGIAKSDFSSGKVKAEFQIGKYAQTVEFGPIYVSNLGAGS